jgi:SAM-dependent methyltransferase
MGWKKLAQWWIEELENDPAYEEEITPLVLDLLDPIEGGAYLDLGCGTGRMLAKIREFGAIGIGCDLNPSLLKLAAGVAPVVCAALPELRWVKPGRFDGAYAGLVLEHIRDEREFFGQVADAVKSDGVLALVINHPVWTAPKSSPIDTRDGEVLWRPGTYFGRGFSDEPAGVHKVRFYHRTMADLLNAASAAGWDLMTTVERGISARQIEKVPEYAGQQHIPRLLGAKWRRRSSEAQVHIE